jgi:prepilin peptidase CpaA
MALLAAFAQGGAEMLVHHALGVVVALPLLLLFYLGLFGGGDVKLMAAVGAFAGPFYGINIAIGSLLVGGLCAAVILLWQGRLWSSLARETRLAPQGQTSADFPKDSFPFATAIATATLGWFLYSLTSGA